MLSKTPQFTGQDMLLDLLIQIFNDNRYISEYIEPRLEEKEKISNITKAYFKDNEELKDITFIFKRSVRNYCEEAYKLGFKHGIDFHFNLLSNKINYDDVLVDEIKD